jgi:MFS transporter, DHA2 family, multidrug resistance protein
MNIWWVGLTLTIATFMELLDTSIANVALPHIAGGTSSSVDEATWVLTSYLVANAVVLPLSAWLSTLLGRKRYYMISVALFTVSSALCGLAPNLGWLIFFRVLQGMGGGGLAPSEQAILVDVFPANKRASAFALYSVAIVAAPAIGPTLGGWITDNWSWRMCFLINVPVGILSLWLTNKLVPEHAGEAKRPPTAPGAEKGSPGPIDFAGILLVMIAFGFIEIVLDKGQEDDWFSSRFICGSTAIAVVALVAAVVWELRIKNPVVALELLKDRNFALACAFYFTFSFVMFGSTVLMPQMLQGLFGYTAMEAGLVLTPGALIIMIMAPIAARLSQRVSSQYLVAFAFAVVALALWHTSQLSLASDHRDFVLARVLQGFGLGFLFVPVSTIAYSYLPSALNDKASSLTNLFRNEGGSFGIAAVTTLLARRSQVHQTILVSHVRPFDPLTIEAMRIIGQAQGHVPPLQTRVLSLVPILKQQVAFLSFLDGFRMLAVVALCAVPVAFLARRALSISGASPSH